MIVGLEVGRRRVFAAALAWPGWCRSGRDGEAALAALAAHEARYAAVAALAGVSVGHDEVMEVVEEVAGNATTDFGAPAAVFAYDREPVPPAERARTAALVRAGYEYFDDVIASSPELLRKGPRGGGRDRDAVAAHVLAADGAYGRKLGLPNPGTGPQEVRAHREAVVGLFASATGGAPPPGGRWPPRYGARRILWHLLDHAFEVEDRRG